MVLADRKIKKAIKRGDIVIEPYAEQNLGTNSYDVTLGGVLAVYLDDVLDMKKAPETKYFDIPDDGFVLLPGELYLGVTKEHIESKRYLPWIDGRSSVGRLGISVHITAGRADRGWIGPLTLEITAVKPVRIYKDVRVGQLTFFKTTKPDVLYSEKPNASYHAYSRLPVPSRLWRSFLTKKQNSFLYEDLSHKDTK